MKKEELKHINIEEIENPNFLKGLKYKELNLLCDDLRNYIIEVTSYSGGHLASNLGTIEATVSLCKTFDFSKDKIIFDVGHQSYTYKILTGRNLEKFRCKDGISGFQKISESPYDHYEAGHSSTSISAADGFALARDLNGEKYDVIAFIGDAAIVSGLAFEGLNMASDKHKIIIVLNDNDMSISKPVGGLAKLFRRFSTSKFYKKSKNAFLKVFKETGWSKPIYKFTYNLKNWLKRHVLSINIFDNLGYSVIGPIDGHDLKALDRAFARAKDSQKSVVVHIQTIKGKGYEPAENDKVGVWHGISGFDIESGKINGEKRMTWSDVYEEEMVKVMGEHTNAMTIYPATGIGSGAENVAKIYPERCIDVGICEEHAFVFAASLSLAGKHPIISMYSTFMQRAYDELSHDLARMNCNATILVDRAGLVGKDGNTHMGIYDEQFLYGIPNTVITMASNKMEADYLIKESFNNHGVFAIRYPRECLKPSNEEVREYAFGKWIQELEGGETAIVSVGPETQTLKSLIINNNKEATLINALYQKPMDQEMIVSLLKYKKVIIYDAYAIKEGFPSILATRLLELGFNGKVIIRAIDDIFVEHATIDEQKQQFNIRPEDILELI